MPPATEAEPPAPSPEVTARRRAAALAGHLGDGPAARQALADPAPTVRAAALGALARLGAIGLEDLTAALGDQAAEVRARAAEVAVTAGGALPGLTVPALVGALRDREARVVEAACFALGEIGEAAGAAGAAGAGWEAAVAALTSVAQEHGDALCREAAVAALGAIGSPAGLPAILAGTGDKPAVRRRAVLALVSFSGPEVDAALARAHEDRDWQVRQAAEDLTDRR